MRGWWIIFVSAVACGQQQATFPSDGEDPKIGGGAELLETVCPGHVETNLQVHCHVNCPEDTGFAGQERDWDLVSITRGHFLSPLSEDAALSMSGCETRVSGRFRGSVLLTRQSGKWVKRWYTPGMVTDNCHKVRLATGRDIPVCLSGDGNMGLLVSTISSIDLATRRVDHLAQAVDNTGNCGMGTRDHRIQVGSIDRVEFGTSPGDDGSFSIFGVRGSFTILPTEDQPCGRPDELRAKLAVNTAPYRIDYVSDGTTYTRVSK